MTTQTEALKLALETAFDLGQQFKLHCEQARWHKGQRELADKTKLVFKQFVENTIKEALAQLEQEPVAIVDANDEGYWAEILPDRSVKVGQHLYAKAPQRRQLDIKTIKRIATYCGEHITDEDVIEITRRVEEEHKIKEET